MRKARSQASARYLAKRARLDKVLTACGWMFDILTVAVSLSAATTDILVCRQFALDEEWLWFGLVLALAIIANIILTAFLLNEPSNILLMKLRVTRSIKFLLIVPFAQIIPAFMWVLQINNDVSNEPKVEDFCLGKDRLALEKTRGPNPNKIVGEEFWNTMPTTDVGTEELANVFGSFHAMGRLEKAIRKYHKSHFYFYVETVVGAIPLVIVQLLAATILQRITWLQVVSISVSLLSIVSKSYVVASSQTISAVVWKFFCCAADLFGLFYIISSIADRSAPKEAQLFIIGGPYVTVMTQIFVFKWMVYIGATALLIIVVCLYMIMFQRHRITKKDISTGALFLGLFLVLGGPVMVCLEALKLSPLVAYLTKHEPISFGKAANALLFSYLTSGTRERQSQKTRNLVYQLVEKRIEGKAQAQKAQQPKRKLGNNTNHTSAPSTTATINSIGDPNLRPNLMELQLQYLCESSSDEEPSGWDDEVAISVEVKERLRRQEAKRQKIQDRYDFDKKAGVNPSCDFNNSPDLVIPVGTNYDSYLKLHIGGSSRRAERMRRRREIRDGTAYLHANNLQSSPTENDTLISKRTANNTTGTRLPHRMPFKMANLDDLVHPAHVPDYPVVPFWGGRRNNENIMLGLLYTFYVILAGVGQLFSALFPLINYPMYYSFQNLLQQMCFYCYAFSLLMILVLLIPVIRYGLFNKRLKWYGYVFPTIWNLESVLQMIESEYIPSVEAIASDAIIGRDKNSNRRDPLGPELVSIVASFMNCTDIDLRGIGQDECKRIKAMHHRNL